MDSHQEPSVSSQIIKEQKTQPTQLIQQTKQAESQSTQQQENKSQWKDVTNIIGAVAPVAASAAASIAAKKYKADLEKEKLQSQERMKKIQLEHKENMKKIDKDFEARIAQQQAEIKNTEAKCKGDADVACINGKTEEKKIEGELQKLQISASTNLLIWIESRLLGNTHWKPLGNDSFISETTGFSFAKTFTGTKDVFDIFSLFFSRQR